MPEYNGNVCEIHPLVVAAESRRHGVGRALVLDVEDAVRQKGAVTLWAGSDDENHETTLSEVDLYLDVAGAIRGARTSAAIRTSSTSVSGLPLWVSYLTRTVEAGPTSSWPSACNGTRLAKRDARRPLHD